MGDASYKVLSIGWGEIVRDGSFYWLDMAVISAAGYVFFRYLILKVFKKHTRRILNFESTCLCVFSFFDVQSYVVMSVMILLGIALRRAEMLPPLYLGTLYITIGIPLFLAFLLFAHAGMNIESAKFICCQEIEAGD